MPDQPSLWGASDEQPDVFYCLTCGNINEGEHKIDFCSPECEKDFDNE